MPSNYTPNLKIEKQATGENSNTWGTRLNDSVIDLIDEAVAGVTTIAFGTTAGDCAIVNANGASAQGRNAVLVLTGAPVSNVALNVPANNKLYGVRSKHTGVKWIKVRPVGAVLGAEVTLDAGGKAIMYSDGNRMYRLTDNTPTAISAAMVPLVQAATTALGRDALDVPRNATKAEVSSASAGNQSPSTSQLGFAILHGFKKYTDASGAANTIAVTCNPAPVSYSEIETLYIKVANTTTSTTVNLNVNALGNKLVYVAGTQGAVAPVAGQLLKNNYYEFLYDPILDGFICLNPSIIWEDGTIQGLNMSYVSTTSFRVDPGFARNENTGSSKVNMSLTSSITKTTSAFAVGTGNGGLDTGSIAINTWYHVHLIQRTSDGVIDVLFSTSPSSPTMPSGFVARRRIGSFRTNTSATTIKAFTQVGDTFIFDEAPIDVSASSTPTTAVTRTLSTPTGVETLAKITGIISITNNSITAYGLLTSLEAGIDVAATNTNANLFGNSDGPSGATETYTPVSLEIKTNTSSQIRSRMSINSAVVTLFIQTRGWLDPRGAYTL